MTVNDHFFTSFVVSSALEAMFPNPVVAGCHVVPVNRNEAFPESVRVLS